ncbi:ABC transporter permease subunit [Rossellomorea sp. YZS02]|uniref:ABC transporter permease subunit n=1 Tax=Rossellomorea sp. YZS02 TaxID=3097358 RepID=UPI002A186261|nr:ABC transporter permease subunit [Rossellomorea sp. YZS02]MDX8344629.1 ABC transporter permease subunit [Rossellomorea sp. YZS02]
MIKKLFKQGSFLAGFFLLVLLLGTSYVNSHFFKEEKGEITQEEYYNNKPLPPSWEHPFGTSAGGGDMFDATLAETVPTLKFALVVTLGRMVISLILGLVYGMFYRRLRWMDVFVEGFHFVPTTLLAFLLLYSMQLMDFNLFMENLDFRWRLITYILIGVGIPSLAQLIGKETHLALQQEYIQGARVLGGRHLHILVKHVLPSVRGKFLLISSGQMIAVLTLMMHVSILGYYIPGWTAFIGSRYYELMISPWIIFFPVLLLTLLIVSLTLMTNGVRTFLDGDYVRRRSSVLSGDRGVRNHSSKSMSF